MKGIKAVVEQFHAAGVKVLLSYNPWDNGSRPSASSDEDVEEEPNSVRMINLVAAVDADGVNGDTMNGMSAIWWDTAQQLNHPVVLQPELGFGAFQWLHNITYNTMSWAYFPYAGAETDDIAWTGVAELPYPSKYSFLVNDHHAQICERWARQHTNGE